MTKPNDRISDELISAYLDGEVTAQERAQVERLLNSEPRYQQTLDELRTLRETLQSLPRHQLDADFHRRVLQLAKQQQDDQSDSSPPAEPGRHGTHADASPRGFRRGLVWACMAVAAAVLLMVYAPPRTQEDLGPVAMQPRSNVRPDEAPAVDDANNRLESFREANREETPPVREKLMRGTSEQSIDRRPAMYERSAAGSAGTELELRSQAAEADSMKFLGDEVSRSKSASPRAEGRDDVIDTWGQRRAGETIADQPAPTFGESMDFALDQKMGSMGGVSANGNGLAADAVIHIRIAPSEGNPAQVLADNLKRNSVALVRQEPVEAGQTIADRRAGQLAREPVASLYASNQAAVDYGFPATRPKAEAIQLFFVQAEAPQIVTAVNELQQEGASVLATVPGPRQVQQLGLDQDSRRRHAAGRAMVESGITATKGLPEGPSPRSVVASEQDEAEESESLGLEKRRLTRFGRDGASQLVAPSRARSVPWEDEPLRQSVAPVEGVERMSELPEAALPALPELAEPTIAEDASRASPYRTEPEGNFAYDVDFWRPPTRPFRDAPVQRGDNYYTWQAPQPTDGIALEQTTQQQIDNLSTEARGRPLQVLFVLHDEGSPPLASEAPAAANELPAEAAPSEPAGAIDPQSPE